MMKKIIYLITACLLLGFLLLNPKAAADASRDGLLLWFHSLVPTLLPFFILSSLLIALDGISCVTRFLHPLFHRVFGCSPDGCFCIAAGFLCGYPVGAKITADLVREKCISAEEGTYLLSFCNNVSPAFLIGFCLTEKLKRPDFLLPALLTVYGAPVLLALFLRRGRRFFPLSPQKKTSGSQISFKIVDVCMMNGLENILKLGCYMILFSMLARLLTAIPCPLPLFTYAGVGIMEITNGISLLTADPRLSFPEKYLFTLGFLAFGGLSGAAQADSMILDSGLSLSSYLKAKLLTVLLVLCLAMLSILLSS